MLQRFVLPLVSSVLCVTALQAQVVINEFSYDDSGTDNREFVELYNAGEFAVDIGDWILDSEDLFGPNTAYAIPTGTLLAAGDYYVIGSGDVPNVDLIVGATNLWENSNESLTLLDVGGAIVDTLVYEAWRGIWNAAVVEGAGVWGNFASIDGLESSWSRLRDGYDTNDNGCDFRLTASSPGTSNDQASILPLSADYDAGTPGDSLPEWQGSFKPGRVIDPTVVDGINQNAIPASPQGGNAAIFWDETGGGNTCTLLSDVSDNIVMEAWVYFDAVLEPAGLREVWTLGFGSTGTFSNLPDPSGAAGFTANGNTGVGWTFEVTDVAATLYLVDYNNGGADPIVLGSKAVTAGVDDGWQRLRLQVIGGNVPPNGRVT